MSTCSSLFPPTSYQLVVILSRAGFDGRRRTILGTCTSHGHEEASIGLRNWPRTLCCCSMIAGEAISWVIMIKGYSTAEVDWILQLRKLLARAGYGRMGCAAGSMYHMWESTIKNNSSRLPDNTLISADYHDYKWHNGEWCVGTRQKHDEKATNHLRHTLEVDEESGHFVLSRHCVSACGPAGRVVSFDMRCLCCKVRAPEGLDRYEGTIITSKTNEKDHLHTLKLEVEQIAYHDTLSSVLENENYSFIVMSDKHVEPAGSYSIKGGVCCAHIKPFEVTWDQVNNTLSCKHFSALNISEDGSEIYFGGDATSEVPWSTMQLVQGVHPEANDDDDDD